MRNLRLILMLMLLAVTQLSYGQASSIIRGLVVDEDGEPIIGAMLHEVDKNNRVYSNTTTDFNGEFSMAIKNPNNKLKVSYVGFKPQTLSIKTNMHIVMKDASTLAEVQVTASRMSNDGSMPIPMRELSGATQTINTKEFEGLSVTSIDDALQGRMAGLDIVANSGDLGAGSSMRIRGSGSINSNAEPLIVLNDIPYESHVDESFDFSNATQEQFANLLAINPEDIEEITVLKDGAAAAVYGARGANGVILIKTKRGVKGPPRVQYLYKFSMHKQPKGRKMLSGDDYTMLMKQAYFNPRQDENACNIPEYNYDPTYPEYWNFVNNTDWVDEVIQYGVTHDNTVNVNGGGEKAKYRASIGYLTQTGTIIEQKLDRISALMNLDYQVSDRLKFSTEFSLTHTTNNKTYDEFGNILDIAYRKMPNVGVYRRDDAGNMTDEFYVIPQSSVLDASQKNLVNPVAMAHQASYKETSMRIIPTLRLQYDILNPEVHRLRYQGYVQFDIENRKDDRMLPRELTSYSWTNDAVNRVSRRDAESLNMQTKHELLFMPKLGEGHSLMLLGAWEMTSGNSQSQDFRKYGLPNGITSPTVAGNESTFSSSKGEWHSMAYMGRLHYAFKERYILDVTVRRDGSTRFGPGNRWGTFPAVSGKWILSDEKWFDEWEWFNTFGIRAGYGKTGRMPDSEYLHYARYNSYYGSGGGNSYIDISTLKPASIRLSNLKWETAQSVNIGVDCNLFDYKVNFDFNMFMDKNKDLLFANQRIPSSTGFGSISYINGGSMEKSGWEFNFWTQNLVKFNDFSFDFNFNLSNYTSKITDMLPEILESYEGEFVKTPNDSRFVNRVQLGNAYGSIYGLRYKGVYQYSDYVEGREGTSPFVQDADGNYIKDENGNPMPMYYDYGGINYKFRGGDAIYEDINHDGTIDELDIVYLGNCNPKLYGGFGFTFRWKQLSINAFFNFRTGNKIANYARMRAENMYTNDNQSIATNWRWRKEGDVTDMPRALYQYGYNWMPSDRFVENGDFLRFKYLTFNYGFTKEVCQKLRLQQLNLYLTLNNLYTWTKYTGVDPEISPNNLTGIVEDWSSTPRSQYFTFGLTVGF